MQRCFVIQPFNSKFDKRFSDVYKPAIQSTGLEPYRVDADPSVDIPIDAIESGIRESVICLADITEDNPNVWYELGYASAAKKPITRLLWALLILCAPLIGPLVSIFTLKKRNSV